MEKITNNIKNTENKKNLEDIKEAKDVENIEDVDNSVNILRKINEKKIYFDLLRRKYQKLEKYKFNNDMYINIIRPLEQKFSKLNFDDSKFKPMNYTIYSKKYVILDKDTKILVCRRCVNNKFIDENDDSENIINESYNKCFKYNNEYTFDRINGTNKVIIYYHARDDILNGEHIKFQNNHKICTICVKGYKVDINGRLYTIKCESINSDNTPYKHLPFEQRNGLSFKNIITNYI